MEALHKEHINLRISFDLLIGYYDMYFKRKEEINILEIIWNAKPNDRIFPSSWAILQGG